MAALPRLSLNDVDVLIIENVGNLVCPIEFDLGEDAKVLITSLTEGDDKPLKYPGGFVAAQVIVVNKIDLEPYLPVSFDKLRVAIGTINHHAPVIALSCTTGAGFDAWLEWIRTAWRAKRAKV
jgi:hydrogenase nickel incorporation protein HypB